MIYSKDIKIVEALAHLDENRGQTIFLIDDEEKLVATCSDGDIRRFLIAGGKIENPVLDAANKFPIYKTLSGKLLNISNDRTVNIIPVLDSNLKIVELIDVTNEKLPIAFPEIGDRETRIVQSVISSSWISSLGKEINLFEEEFSKYVGVKHGIAVSNGSTALLVALMAIGIAPNDEVIIPALTFGAVPNAVLLAGGKIVFADVCNDRPTIDENKIVEAISKNTKAIIVVHSYGYVVDVERLKAIIPNDIIIIEDCAEAHSASLRGKRVGGIGDISCYSFFANKIITTGEGGMCCTNNDVLAEKIKIIKNHGMDPNNRYFHVEKGFNFRMTNIQGAIGRVQLENIENNIRSRKYCLKIWDKFLHENNINFKNFRKLNDEDPAPWFYNIYFEDIIFKRQLMNLIKILEIECRDFFYPLPSMGIFGPVSEANFKNSLHVSKVGLSLPVYSATDKVHTLEKRLGLS